MKTRQAPGEILAVKKKVRLLDGYRCTDCGMRNAEHIKEHGTQLEVHRVVPGSLYTVSGCTTLCIGCHAKMPRRGKGERRKVEPWHPATVTLPAEWSTLLRKLASDTPTPPNWLVIMLLKQEAESRGVAVPEAPWERRPRSKP